MSRVPCVWLKIRRKIWDLKDFKVWGIGDWVSSSERVALAKISRFFLCVHRNLPMNGEKLEEGETKRQRRVKGRDFHLRVKLMLYFSLITIFKTFFIFKCVLFYFTEKKNWNCFQIAFQKSLFNLHHCVYVCVCVCLCLYTCWLPLSLLKIILCRSKILSVMFDDSFSLFQILFESLCI